MEEHPEQDRQTEPSEQGDLRQMVYILLTVFIICGGNGVGILTAAVIWRYAHRLAPAIVSVVGITALAVLGGVLVVRSHRKGRRQARVPSPAEDGTREERK